MLADSGEDAIAFSDKSDYAANIETAEAIAPTIERTAPSIPLTHVDTPTQKTCEEVAALMGIPLQRTVKSVALVTTAGRFTLSLVRGAHSINEIKLAKLAGMSDSRLATEAEIVAHLGCEPGFIGPLGMIPTTDEYRQFIGNLIGPITVIADRTVAALGDFVVGANRKGVHLAGVNWGRDLAEPDHVADIRNVVVGDPSPDGQGTLGIARGIEVGHVFQLGQNYSEAMKATVLNDAGKPLTEQCSWATNATVSASPAS